MLPRHDFSPSRAPAAAPRPYDERLSVLVADDDPSSCRFLCDALGALGARTAACSNGATALHRARVQHFDLLLLDCRMPGAGAREILTQLRRDPRALSVGSVAIATT